MDAGTSSLQPRVFFDGARFLLWNARHVHALRCVHRICGSLIGALPTNKRQDAEHGLPLSLLFEEVLLLAEEGIVEVVDSSGAASPAAPAAAADAPAADEGGAASSSSASKPAHFVTISTECTEWAQEALPRLEPAQIRLASAGTGRLLHALTFRALWERGLYITPATAFGADYLCYKGDPFRHHAHLLVHVMPPGRKMRPVELACAARLASSVKKSAVLAECDGEAGAVRFVEIDPATACMSHRERKMAEEGRWAPERRPVPRSWALVEKEGWDEIQPGNKRPRMSRAAKRAAAKAAAPPGAAATEESQEEVAAAAAAKAAAEAADLEGHSAWWAPEPAPEPSFAAEGAWAAQPLPGEGTTSDEQREEAPPPPPP